MRVRVNRCTEESSFPVLPFLRVADLSVEREDTTVSAFRTTDERVAAVAELAYRLWEERGRPEGSPDEDWYRAEVIVDRQDDRVGEKRDALDTARSRTRRKSGPRRPRLGLVAAGELDRPGKRRARREKSRTEK